MKPEIIHQLFNINKKFYQTFAVQFSSTRLHIQPGVKEIFNYINNNENILDLGSGNGELVIALMKKGFNGKYIGIDFCDQFIELSIEKINQNIKTNRFDPLYLRLNLLDYDWSKKLVDFKFDTILAFAVLHHIPANSTRVRIMKDIKDLLVKSNKLKARKQFIHSEWQLQNSSKFEQKLISWDTLGLSNRDVEYGDYLIDWRYGGYGVRYVHIFNEKELSNLAEESGFRINHSYYSDGKNGKLALYQIWEPE